MNIDGQNWNEKAVVEHHPTEENFVNRYMTDMFPDTPEPQRRLKLAGAYRLICAEAGYTPNASKPPIQDDKGNDAE